MLLSAWKGVLMLFYGYGLVNQMSCSCSGPNDLDDDTSPDVKNTRRRTRID